MWTQKGTGKGAEKGTENAARPAKGQYGPYLSPRVSLQRLIMPKSLHQRTDLVGNLSWKKDHTLPIVPINESQT